MQHNPDLGATLGFSCAAQLEASWQARAVGIASMVALHCFGMGTEALAGQQLGWKTLALINPIVTITEVFIIGSNGILDLVGGWRDPIQTWKNGAHKWVGLVDKRGDGSEEGWDDGQEGEGDSEHHRTSSSGYELNISSTIRNSTAYPRDSYVMVLRALGPLASGIAAIQGIYNQGFASRLCATVDNAVLPYYYVSLARLLMLPVMPRIKWRIPQDERPKIRPSRLSWLAYALLLILWASTAYGTAQWYLVRNVFWTLPGGPAFWILQAARDMTAQVSWVVTFIAIFTNNRSGRWVLMVQTVLGIVFVGLAYVYLLHHTPELFLAAHKILPHDFHDG
ncbi:hypothetical protein HDV00_002208 [Rhizophlyctis rosea]|nr:hypothetical protein HDV00_002208 [Rhizophlyctis rosea]